MQPIFLLLMSWFCNNQIKQTQISQFTRVKSTVYAIQSIQHKLSPTSVDELIDCVKEAFWQQPVSTVEKIFLTLQQCMECTMLERGSNQYKLPHMGKGQFLGGLESFLKC